MQAERAPFADVALVAALVLSFAIHRVGESSESALANPNAEAAAAQAIRDAQAAAEALEALMLELDELEKQVTQALNAISEAETEVGRATAVARLRQLRQELDEMKQRIPAARALADRGDRIKCVCVPRRCIGNPLAKGRS